MTQNERKDAILAGVPSGEVQDQALQALLDRVHVLGAEVMSKPAGETSSERSERRSSDSFMSIPDIVPMPKKVRYVCPGNPNCEKCWNRQTCLSVEWVIVEREA